MNPRATRRFARGDGVALLGDVGFRVCRRGGETLNHPTGVDARVRGPWAARLPASAPALRERVEQENRRAGDKREEEPPYEEEETGFGWAEVGNFFRAPAARPKLGSFMSVVESDPGT